jgi:uncharacterized RDD family membrane protein YckC
MQAGTLPRAQVPRIRLRLLAMLYELFLAFSVTFFAALAFAWLSRGQMSGAVRHVFQFYLFCVLGLYFVTCWSRGGRTLPMQTWRMRIIACDGRRPGVARAILRYVLAWPSIFLLCVGLLWALVDRDRQFLHDRLSGTRIVLHDQITAS